MAPGDLAGKRIVLGVTGSVAAYKAAVIASRLVKGGADVHVVMTENALKMIGAPTFWSITGNPVIQDMWKEPEDADIIHISLPESADLFLVAPATANVIGKIANGIADDMLSTMILSARCPVMIAPAMNTNMYTNPMVVANLDYLRQDAFNFIIMEPDTGRLACGAEGVGRLADPEKIVRRAEEVLIGGPRDYSGLTVLITAGPTREPIDPVRYISNYSSGKMGYALAEAATKRGASVKLISGPTDLPVPAGAQVQYVTTVDEMHSGVLDNLDDVDVMISAAAPSDFAPKVKSNKKIKKTDAEEALVLELDKTVDILADAAKNKEDMTVVGFAAETQDLEEYAKSKLKKKKLDLIVANDVSTGSDVFGSDSNEVTLISRKGEIEKWPRMSKTEVANGILDYISNHFLEERH